MGQLDRTEYRFRHGQTVWVRNFEDILRTLDKESSLDGLPFMPEMVKYCGKSFKVFRLASKTCVEGFGIRHMDGTVFLENLRCDGSAHDGCQRACRLFWKEDWLTDQPPVKSQVSGRESESLASEKLSTKYGDRYHCQSTELAHATTELPKGKLWQYMNDVRIGEMTLTHLIWLAFNSILKKMGCKLGMDTCNEVHGRGKKTESATLDLKPGELVEVKSRKEIKKSLNLEGRNKGLMFEHSMLDYCGKRFRVTGRLNKIIHEESGKMIHLKNTVILENVICQTACPRANLIYWREIWLKRVNQAEDRVTQVRVPQSRKKHMAV